MALILARASDSVVQVMDVPGLLTRGSAAQIVEAAHSVMTNFPPEHCAKPLLTQARSPSTTEKIMNQLCDEKNGIYIYQYRKK